MLVRCAWECLFQEPGSACAASQCEELKLPAMQTGFSRRPSQCLRRLVPCHITEHPGNHGMVQPGLPPSLWPGAAGAPRGSAFPRAGPFPGAGLGRAGQARRPWGSRAVLAPLGAEPSRSFLKAASASAASPPFPGRRSCRRVQRQRPPSIGPVPPALPQPCADSAAPVCQLPPKAGDS